MMAYFALAATVAMDNAEAGVDRIDGQSMRANEVVNPLSPPVFFRNSFGVVTNRRQFEQFYLTVGRPIGPYVFARR